MTSPSKDKHSMNTPNVSSGAIGKGKEKQGRRNYDTLNSSLENSFAVEISANGNDATSNRQGENFTLYIYTYFYFVLMLSFFFFMYISQY